MKIAVFLNSGLFTEYSRPLCQKSAQVYVEGPSTPTIDREHTLVMRSMPEILQLSELVREESETPRMVSERARSLASEAAEACNALGRALHSRNRRITLDDCVHVVNTQELYRQLLETQELSDVALRGLNRLREMIKDVSALALTLVQDVPSDAFGEGKPRFKSCSEAYVSGALTSPKAKGHFEVLLQCFPQLVQTTLEARRRLGAQASPLSKDEARLFENAAQHLVRGNRQSIGAEFILGCWNNDGDGSLRASFRRRQWCEAETTYLELVRRGVRVDVAAANLHGIEQNFVRDGEATRFATLPAWTRCAPPGYWDTVAFRCFDPVLADGSVRSSWPAVGPRQSTSRYGTLEPRPQGGSNGPGGARR